MFPSHSSEDPVDDFPNPSGDEDEPLHPPPGSPEPTIAELPPEQPSPAGTGSALQEQLTRILRRLRTVEQTAISAHSAANNAVTTANSVARAPQATTHTSIITDPTTFKRSPHQVSAPFDLDTKTGLSLYVQAQTKVEPPFDGKPVNLPSFLYNLKADVELYHLHPATIVQDRLSISHNVLTDYGSITEEMSTYFFDISRRNLLRGFDAFGSTVPLPGLDDDARLLKARECQTITILYQKVLSSLTPHYKKQLLPKLDTFGNDGTKLLLHIITDTQSTSTTAMRNAQMDLHKLHLKDSQWDVTKLHTSFDALVATLRSAGTTVDDNQQMLLLLQAYETNLDNDDWITHVRTLRSSQNVGMITSPAQMMESAKTFYLDLKRTGKWKKKPVPSQTAFPAAASASSGSQQRSSAPRGTRSSNDWKFDKSLSSSNTLSRRDRTYHWCTGPGHNNRPMWVAHQPGTCTPRGSSGSSSRSSANTVQNSTSTSAPTSASRKTLSKTSFKKQLKTMLSETDDDLQTVVNKITDLQYE